MLVKTTAALVCCWVVINIDQIPVALALSPPEISQIVKSSTVRIVTDRDSASGTIIKQQGNEYHVLTIAPKIKGNNITILTPDGKRYSAQRSQQPSLAIDAVILKFTSTNNYKTASIINIPFAQRNIFIAGFPKATRTITSPIYTLRPANIIDTRSNPKGYGLAYNSSLLPGMEGGGIFDENGILIGIHGRLVSIRNLPDQTNGDVQFQSGSYVGISINTFLAAAQASGNDVYSTPLNTSTSTTVSEVDGIVQNAGNLNNNFRLAAAQQAYDAGQYRSAIQIYDEHIRKNPNDPLAYGGRGNAKFALGDKPGAIADFDRALQLDPKLVLILRNRAIAKAGVNDLNGAIVDIRQAINLQPQDPELHYMLGLGLYKQGQKPAALQSFQTARSLYQNQGKSAEVRKMDGIIRQLQQG
jgi:tetratricopeptide (TPR) repeat protein